MKAAKLLFTIFSVAAIVIAGCSGDNLVTAPAADNGPDIDNASVNLAAPAEIGNNAKAETGSFEFEIQRIEFSAKVKKLDLEGGCWYLEPTESIRYTPYFEQDAPVLREGMELYVSGYVDKNLNSSCQTGPVFRIEKYKIDSKDDTKTTGGEGSESRYTSTGGSRLSEERNMIPATLEDEPQAELINLKGYLSINEEGCLYLSWEDRVIAELELDSQSGNDVPEGKLVVVKGSYSLLTSSPCQLGPLFYVEKLQVIDDKDQSQDNKSSGK